MRARGIVPISERIRLSHSCLKWGLRSYLSATHVRQFCTMLKGGHSFQRRQENQMRKQENQRKFPNVSGELSQTSEDKPHKIMRAVPATILLVLSAASWFMYFNFYYEWNSERAVHWLPLSVLLTISTATIYGCKINGLFPKISLHLIFGFLESQLLAVVYLSFFPLQLLIISARMGKGQHYAKCLFIPPVAYLA